MAQNLKVLIIGAGIGGLTAAIALRQQGHEVEVFERSRLASEVGAAVHVAPNCTVLLNRLGVYPEEFNGTVYQGMAMKNEAAEIKHAVTVSDETRKQWPAQYWLVHRIDLHAALKHAATTPDRPGIPAILRTSSAVTSVDPSTATITLADGTTATGDLVLAADGVHSAARNTVAGGTYATKPSGKACYRWLMPAAPLRADPELRDLVGGEPGVVTEIAGGDRRVVFYPCHGGELMNFAAFVPRAEAGAAIPAGWNQGGQKERLVGSFRGLGFAPRVVRMLEMAPEGKVAVWDLLDLDVLPTWVNGRVALLGDAAHPFLPYMGQGAAQAIEDAASIGALLPLGTTPQDIPRRLQLYEKARKERVDWVQQFTRMRGQDGGCEGDEVAEALRRCIGYDAWKHALDVLEADVKGQKAFGLEARI